MAGYTWKRTKGHNFDLQMRLTRRVPSASLPLCQAKISGSTPEAEQKELRQRKKKNKKEGKQKKAQRCGAVKYSQRQITV